MKDAKKSFAALAQKMETLQESNQGSLKGGFAAFTAPVAPIDKGGTVTVTVAVGSTCGCGCSVQEATR
jgi:hypothetical protein